MKINRLSTILKGEFLSYMLLGFITLIIYLSTALAQYI